MSHAQKWNTMVEQQALPPDAVVVAKVDRNVTAEEAHLIQRAIVRAWPPADGRILVTTPAIDLEVLSAQSGLDRLLEIRALIDEAIEQASVDAAMDAPAA